MPAQHAAINIRSSAPHTNGKPTDVTESIHWRYSNSHEDWVKFRLTFEGGKKFIEQYMVKLSAREGTTDFKNRKDIAYCPNAAKAAIKDITQSIFQPMSDVIRAGGSDSYRSAINGEKGGVDYHGSSMSAFIGSEIINELLIIGKIGVLVDNHKDLGTTEADLQDKHPYLAAYKAEDILNWSISDQRKGFDALLLREFHEELDDFGLSAGIVKRFRYMRRMEDGVLVQFFNEDGDLINTVKLQIAKIPFVLFEIEDSLLRDISDYQIALMNMESSDISFSLKANFPFYYEYYDALMTPPGKKKPANPNATGAESETTAKKEEIAVGGLHGRKIHKDFNPPGFINPDPDTLRVSMEKQQQIKDDIRALVNLNLATLNPRRQSAESKDHDTKSLEASLSFIALILQRGEQEIAELWVLFDGKTKSVRVTYPKNYSLKTEEDRRDEATELDKLADKVPSETFRREIKKKIAKALLSGAVTDEQMDKILKEIEDSEVLTSDPNMILSAHKEGLVDDITASTAIGFDGQKVVPKAKEDRAERIKLTMEAQGGPENASSSRGAPEFDKGQDDSSAEKDGKAKRGKADKTDLGSEQK